MENNEEFIKDRNEAFSSGDKDKIIKYCEKYHIELPSDEIIFWKGVHKTICNLFLSENSSISIAQYVKSYDWLRSHNSDPSIWR